jgi:hypothetical protein
LLLSLLLNPGVITKERKGRDEEEEADREQRLRSSNTPPSLT